MHRRSVEDNLGAVRPAAEWVETILADANLAEDQRHDVHVCLEEALANLIMHGRARNGDKGISIAVEGSHDSATLLITDRCTPFDVTDESVFAAPSPHDESRIGGNGLKLLRAFAGDLEYSTHGGGNELRMRFGAAAPGRERKLIRSIPAFAQTPEDVLVAMLNGAERLSFALGDLLLTQGEPSEHALILIAGDVAVVNQSAHGEAPVAQIAAPALIGEIGALARLRRTASVRARTPVEALRIGRDALLLAGKHQPDLLVSVIAQLGQQTQNINNALGLYAAGLSALERDDLESTILADLNNPSPDLKNFAEAFQRLAHRVTTERRARTELASATLIQRAMLPAPLDPALLGGRCTAFASMRPAREVGGDLFDLSLLDQNRLALVVGDVCGKGVPASLFMCATITALRLASQHESDLSKMMAQANDALHAQNAMSMFTTLFYGVLDLESGRLDYINCGHNPPVLLRCDGDCAELAGRGPPLGFFPGQRWQANTVQLQAGDGVFLFSDGVTECINPANEEYGDERLIETLKTHRRSGAEGLVHAVIADADRFAAGAEQADDITCLAAFFAPS